MKTEKELSQVIDYCLQQKAELDEMESAVESIKDIPHKRDDVASFCRYAEEHRANLRSSYSLFTSLWQQLDKGRLLQALIADVERKKHVAVATARERGNTMQETHRALGEADALDEVLERLQGIAWLDGLKSPRDM